MLICIPNVLGKQDVADFRRIMDGQYVGDADQHLIGNQYLAEIISAAVRPGASKTNGVAL